MESKRNRIGRPRRLFSTSTSAASEASANETIAAYSSFGDLENPLTVSKSAAVPKTATIYALVLQAIEFTGTTRKGASFLAIKKWVFDNREGNQDRLLGLIKKAMRKGLDSGVICRASATKSCNGLTGSFLLVNKESKKRFGSSQEKSNRKMKTGMPTAASKPAEKEAMAPKVQIKPLKISKDKVTTKQKEENTVKLSKTKKPVTKTQSDGVSVKPNSKSGKKNAMNSLQSVINPVKKTRKIKEAPNTTQEAKNNEKSATKTNRKPASKTDKPATKSIASRATSKMTRKKHTTKLTEKFQKDLSDSELLEKTFYHESTKSYSSDTEVDIGKNWILFS